METAAWCGNNGEGSSAGKMVTAAEERNGVTMTTVAVVMAGAGGQCRRRKLRGNEESSVKWRRRGDN